MTVINNNLPTQYGGSIYINNISMNISTDIIFYSPYSTKLGLSAWSAVSPIIGHTPGTVKRIVSRSVAYLQDGRNRGGMDTPRWRYRERGTVYA